ncbi:peptidoglycan DD-metalloendopeptidase family protein [Microbacterium esteraromaticum]
MHSVRSEDGAVPTRRANRLRTAAQAGSADSATPDARQATTAATNVAATDAAVAAERVATAVSSAATSRRARRLAASGTPAAQPMTAPAQVIASPAQSAPVESVTVVPEPVAPARPIFEEAVPTGPAPVAVEPAPRAADPIVSTPDVAETVAVGESDVDAFAAASELLGFAAIDDADEIEVDAAAERDNVEPEAAVPVADEAVVEGAAPAHIVQPRPRRMLRRVVAAGASFGVMGVAGLIAVSMTLPVSAVAASQGADARTSTSLATAGDTASQQVADDEIQAFVASSDVEGDVLARSDAFSSVSLSQVAAEEGIKFSESLYTNDPDAAIQWPFIVGVAMSSPYGPRWGRLHAGIDLVPGNGAPIQAIADGVVRTASEAGGAYGVNVYIDHVIDGQVITSHYAHMQYGSLQVQSGQKVKVGDIIGKVGNTGRSYGAHLHFEIIINGSQIDPLPWMRENAGRYEY